jgi:hypothetical protein
MTKKALSAPVASMHVRISKNVLAVALAAVLMAVAYGAAVFTGSKGGHYESKSTSSSYTAICSTGGICQTTPLSSPPQLVRVDDQNGDGSGLLVVFRFALMLVCFCQFRRFVRRDLL